MSEMTAELQHMARSVIREARRIATERPRALAAVVGGASAALVAVISLTGLYGPDPSQWLGLGSLVVPLAGAVGAGVGTALQQYSNRRLHKALDAAEVEAATTKVRASSDVLVATEEAKAKRIRREAFARDAQNLRDQVESLTTMIDAEFAKDEPDAACIDALRAARTGAIRELHLFLSSDGGEPRREQATQAVERDRVDILERTIRDLPEGDRRRAAEEELRMKKAALAAQQQASAGQGARPRTL